MICDPLIWELPVNHDICGGRDSIFGGCALAAGILSGTHTFTQMKLNVVTYGQ